MLQNLHDFNLNIQCDPGMGVTVVLSHDVVNGSSISANGVSFVDALERLIVFVQTAKLKDQIWKDPLIIGSRKSDAYSDEAHMTIYDAVMDIFDEEMPFTQEQYEFLKTKFVSKNTAWNKLKSNIEAENIAIPTDWAKQFDTNWVRREFPEKHNELTENRAIAFLQRLTLEGGAIVCSEACSERELAYAKKEGRFFVDENNYGYVLKLEKWRSLAERSVDYVFDLSEKSQVTPEEYLDTHANAN